MDFPLRASGSRTGMEAVHHLREVCKCRSSQQRVFDLVSRYLYPIVRRLLLSQRESKAEIEANALHELWRPKRLSSKPPFYCRRQFSIELSESLTGNLSKLVSGPVA